MLGIGLGGPHGVVAVRVAAKHPPAARGSFHSQPRRADGPAASGAKVKGGAHAPHINPPGAARGRTQRGALFLPGLIPGALRRLAQFPMDCLGVVMRPQGVNVRTWARASLKWWRRSASEATKLSGHEQFNRLPRRSRTGWGQGAAWLPPERPGSQSDP